MLVQCGRPGQRTPATAPSVAGADAARPMRLTEAGEERAATRTDSAPRIDPRDTAFAGHRLSAPPLYPSDFTIGSLRTAGLSAIERAVRQSAIGLLTTVGAGQPPPADALLDPTPGARTTFDELAEEAQGVRAIRVGRPVPVGQGAYSVPFVLLGDEERWSGELIMESAAGRWYSSDIQASRSRSERVGSYAPGVDMPGSYW